jgi:hypothetical protein
LSEEPSSMASATSVSRRVSVQVPLLVIKYRHRGPQLSPGRAHRRIILGVPTVSDRIAQAVVRLLLEPILEPVFTLAMVEIDHAVSGTGSRF